MSFATGRQQKSEGLGNYQGHPGEQERPSPQSSFLFLLKNDRRSDQRPPLFNRQLSHHTRRHYHRMAKKSTPVGRNGPGAAAYRDPLHPPNISDVEPDNIELLAETTSSF